MNTSPESRMHAPLRTRISVDLPAPFSPRRTCTSPRLRSNDTSSSALTPGNCLQIPFICSTGTGSIVWDTARAVCCACTSVSTLSRGTPIWYTPRAMANNYDVLAIGRSSIDLYAHQIGVPITEVTSFDAYVGGCPTNISVGTRRLGLRSALLTAVGADQVGDFVLAFLQKE